MKKIITLLLGVLFNFSALANCEDAYRLAANKRAKTVRIISLGVAATSPFLIFASGGIAALAYPGMLGGLGVGKSVSSSGTTFGKVLATLKGNPHYVAKKIAKKVNEDKNDPEFLNRIQMIVNDLNESQEACPYMGYDKNFKDIYQIYNLKKFSKIVEAEYRERYVDYAN